MTIEEAAELKQGDVIKCKGTCGNHRTLITSYIEGGNLHWKQEGSTCGHCWKISDLEIVSKKSQEEINNYEIY